VRLETPGIIIGSLLTPLSGRTREGERSESKRPRGNPSWSNYLFLVSSHEALQKGGKKGKRPFGSISKSNLGAKNFPI